MSAKSGPVQHTPFSIDDINAQAAEWIVLLSSDDSAQAEQARIDFEDWKRAHPKHAEAARRMEETVSQFQGMKTQIADHPRPARAAINAAITVTKKPIFNHKKTSRKKRAADMLMLFVALILPAWLVSEAETTAYWLADVRTDTGEWQSQTLADGSKLSLSSASAVNFRYDENTRKIELIKGEILVDVAKDATRPFIVETKYGAIRALGTRFTVNHQADATALAMLESKVLAKSKNSVPSVNLVMPVNQHSKNLSLKMADRENLEMIVSAGERIRMSPDGLTATEKFNIRSVDDAWKYHQLVVQNQPLSEVLDALSRHRAGSIQYSRQEIEAIKVSAVLPLDDTDRALQLLMTSFPNLRVRSLTTYLVFVDAP